MKKRKRILAGLLGLIMLVLLLPLGAWAESDAELNEADLGKRVSIKKSEPGLAVTDGVAMLLRRAAIREGADRSVWRGFTESYVMAQNGGATVSGSRTYSQNGYNYTVKAYKAEDMSASDWEATLSRHPEGVVLRFKNAGGEDEPSVLLCYASSGTFYCLDPDPAADAGFVTVSASAYGKSAAIGKSQSKFLNAITYYYAVSSKINAHTHTYGTEGDSLGVCTGCGYTYYLENESEFSGKGTPAAGLSSVGIKLRPYAASGYIQEDGATVRFTSVNVLGITKNHFGNVWYKVESVDKRYSGYIWEDNLTVSGSSAVIITDVTAPANNSVAGTGAGTETAGTVRATGAQLSGVSAAVFAYDSLNSAELNSVLYNTLSASSAKTLAGKRAELRAYADKLESSSFELSLFSSEIRFDRLAGGKRYLYAVTATDTDGNSTTVYKAFYLSEGLETKKEHTVRFSVSGSVTEKTVADGESVTLPEAYRTGYTFLGWAEGESGEADYTPGSKFVPEADVTLYALFRKIAAPAVPKLSASRTDAAVGETVSLQASASGAESYTVYVYSSGELVRTQSFRSGKMSLAFEKAGTYSVKAEAFAGEEGSGQSSAVKITVHAPVTVTFMNGSALWAEQQVDYGGSAAEPAAPARPGSTFTGWDGSMKNICEDTVLHAEFTSGAYTVTFLDESGKTLSRQQVAYGESANAPEAPGKAGYVFLSWDSEAWQRVTEDGLTVSPVYVKQADTPVLTASVTKATTVGSGKLVAYTLTNNGYATVAGRAQLTGRSASGEKTGKATGGTFVLGPGESFTESVFVLTKAPTVWEIEVTDPAGERLLAEPALRLASGDGESRLWVSESELKQIGTSYKKIEESKQYSSSSTETYTTPASSFLDWDKKSGSETDAWSAWSDWQTEPVTATKTVEVEKRQVVTVAAHTEYRYGRWYAENVVSSSTDEKHALAVSPSLAYAKSVWKNASTSFTKQFSAWSTARFAANGSFRNKLKDNEKTYYNNASGFFFWHIFYTGAPSENNEYFWEESRSVPAETETQYRFRVRENGEASNVFTHKKEAVWSFKSVKNAGTRKVLHISFNGTAGGSPVTLNGSLGYAAANKDAILNVSVSDGNGHENTYTEQIRLDGSGSYSVRVADLSGLTVIDAPCCVYLTLAGSTGSVCIGTFTSAGSNHTVTFADGLTGELLSKQTVSDGGSAEAPEARNHEGYLFSGWNRTPARITEDTVITAEYERETCTVIFSDSVAGTETAVSGVPYGGAAEEPKVKETPGYTFLGWNVPDGGSLSRVTGPMRAEAVYAENRHTVTYLSAPKGYDAKGAAQTDVLATVIVRDGDYLTVPEIDGDMHVPDSMYFLGWSEGAAEPVTADLILVPVLGCIMDAEEVTPSLPGGLYAGEEKLTLRAADTEQLSVRYRINTSKAAGDWYDYNIRKSPEITVSSSGTLEIESSSPDKNTKTVSYTYTIAASSSLPAVPVFKSVTQTDASTVTVTWGAVKNASGYILTRTSDCGEVCTHMLTGTSFEDEGLRARRTYSYSVSAFIMSEKAGSAFLLEGKSAKAQSVYFYGADKPVKKITVKAPSSVFTDSSVQLEATVTPTDAAEKTVYWTVDSGSSHGKVSTEGVFTALSAGSVTVSARATDGSGVYGTAKITVKEPEKNAATLSVSNASAKSGNTATVTVSLSRNEEASAIHFTVRYNSSKLTLKTAKKGGLMSGESPKISTKTGYVTFTYDGDTITDTGTLLTLSFTVRSGAAGSAYVQIATEDDGYDLTIRDGSDRTVDVAVKNGAVSVSGLEYGDVDQNGTVDVEDAYMVRSYINGDLRLDAEQKAAADVNGDGKINSTDITLIRKYIVKLITVFPVEE